MPPLHDSLRSCYRGRRMRALVIAACCAAMIGRAAAAPAPTGLVVLGENTAANTSVRHALEQWLQHRGYDAQSAPLDDKAVARIADCFQVHDTSCEQSIIDARSRTDVVVVALVEAGQNRAIAIEVYWLAKGHPAVAERRACEDCTPDALGGTIDSIMNVLAGSSTTNGRVTITTKPAGLTIVIDTIVAGVTPLERDLAPGKHDVVVMKGTQRVGSKSLTVTASETAEVAVPVHLELQRSRVPGGVLLGVGAAAIAAAGVMYALSPIDDGTRYRYRDYRPPAIGIGIGGAITLITGAILLGRAWRPEFVP